MLGVISETSTLAAILAGLREPDFVGYRASRARVGAVGLGLALWTSAGVAGPITYTDTTSGAAIIVGGTTHACPTGAEASCATITITATGDTSDVTYFQIGGGPVDPSACNGVNIAAFTGSACGYEDKALKTATLSVTFGDGSPGYTTGINIAASSLFVSVDKKNLGVGFGSGANPTYPLTAFGYYTSTDPYATYDLASDFSVTGDPAFCPTIALCITGTPLTATDGTPFTIAYPWDLGTATFPPSVFTSTLGVAAVPEPSTWAMMLLGVASVGFASYSSSRRSATV